MTWWRSRPTWAPWSRNWASPSARLVAQRRQGGDRRAKRLGGAAVERQQRRARLAAIAPHDAQGGFQAGRSGALGQLPQGRDLFLHRTRCEKLLVAAQLVKPEHQARRDRRKR